MFINMDIEKEHIKISENCADRNGPKWVVISWNLNSDHFATILFLPNDWNKKSQPFRPK